MKEKIFKIINSCERYEQLESCRKWLKNIEISTNDRLAYNEAIQLKKREIINKGILKNNIENRFPVDDEQQEKH